MRAVRIDAFGGPEVLTPVELPDPVAGPGEILIRTAAVGVNRADALIRAGNYHRVVKPPLIPGLEASGTVLAVGEGVEDITPGQRVITQGAANAPGLYAELAAVPAGRVTVLPDGVDLLSAAALPIAWLSAWYCLRRLGGLAAEQTVVVQAAASGVGSAAVQIAAAAGARVIAVAGSSAKTRWVAGLGAHHTVDSSAFPGGAVVDEVLRLTGGAGADIVLDTVGGDVFAQSLREAAFAGRVIALANVALRPSTVDTRDFYPRNVSVHGFQLTGLIDHGYDPRPDLRAIADGVAAATFRVPVEATFPLHEASLAHRRLEDRANLGKIVLTTGR
ncbi:zinc-binding alcohol dehydrogenase family protein [Streptomyces polygonati]|uniref:Zinc-binding alcohol dehydrogenase family protein n=1 Tax=Streptomyces polygonati TaxID=1617087 RepID=A0ABV8HLX6_9ACTN